MDNFLRKLYSNCSNLYRTLRIAAHIGCGCLRVVTRAYLNKITHTEMNTMVKQIAIKVLRLTKTRYKISYVRPFHFEENTSYILMSNHQSLMDIPLIYASMAGTIRFIAKKELFQIPLFGKMLKISECVPVDRSKSTRGTDFFKKVKEKINKNIFIWIFPEGTRSRTANLLPFKSGGFRLAKEISAKIIPVGIINTRAVLPPGKLFFGLHKTIELKIGEPIDTSTYQTSAEQKNLMDEVRCRIENLLQHEQVLTVR